MIARKAPMRVALAELLRTLFIAVLAIALPGCSKSEYEVAEVEGTLTVNGRPGHKIHIEFVPDGIKGPRSAADTDEQGHFVAKLMKQDGTSPAGAVVGPHKVTLS